MMGASCLLTPQPNSKKEEEKYQSTTITLSPSFVRCKAHSINNPINEESPSESITTNNNKLVIKILNAMILPKK